MNIYRYTVRLLDPLFYAREGLSAAFTPPYLHATAMNLAVKCALCLDPQDQPYLISDLNGGRNTARYQNSLVSDDFYFTPARLTSPLKYMPEITKGENDGFASRVTAGEILKVETLNYIPPDSIFKGFLIVRNELDFPDLIRLGTFRGKATITIAPLRNIKPLSEERLVSHPVDPLVTPVKRGTMINMFPYPIIENATTKHGIEGKVESDRFSDVVALPADWQFESPAEIGGKRDGVIL